MTSPKISAAEIADRLGLHRPTPEQEAIIESPLVPRLVVAGAGSGKTATMVDRVVWLVANDLVRADQVLGVTFTRKAAGELRERMRARLEHLRRQGLISAQAQDGVSDPSVSTYHSYANTLVKNYGLRLGIEQDAQMLTASQSWQLAAQLVERLDPKMLGENPPAKSTIIKDMLALASECSEHLIDSQKLIDFCDEQIVKISAIPTPGPTKNSKPTLERLENKRLYAELVRRYNQLKKNMQVMDYGDLLSNAAQIAKTVDVAGEVERDKYRVVLLDEFQDTSHAQMQLFSDLFGAGSSVSGHPVMAVGDPKQSIYGFRGASDGQLFDFYKFFPAEDNKASYLTTAWRNDSSILDVANLVAEPLKKPASYVRAVSEVEVPDLVARPGAGQGRVEIAQYLTDSDEALSIVSDIARRRAEINDHNAASDQKKPMPTMAVLCRKRAGMEPIRAACEDLGVPYQVVGLGGLLNTPEIVDTVAYLRVLSDPGRSDALMRILSGARWRLGLADLLAFSDWAAYLERLRRAEIQTGISADIDEVLKAEAAQRGATSTHELTVEETRTAKIRERMDDIAKHVEADVTDGASLIEALENLPKSGWESSHGRTITDEGLARLTALQAELAYLRDFVADDLSVLLYEIERTILLDIELAVKPGATAHLARRNLDAFHDVAAQFLLTAPRFAATLQATAAGEAPQDGEEAVRFTLSASSGSAVSVNAFLAWLDTAVEQEGGLELATEEPRADAVQILTVHASKGLEWDHVYIPGMVDGDFPSTKDPRWTQSASKLPWPLRGDRLHLPELQTGVSDLKEFEEMMELFKEDSISHAVAEERRLAYVGITRARSLLVLSSSPWTGTRTKPAQISRFIMDLFESQGDKAPELDAKNLRVPVSVTHVVDPASIGEENPQAAAVTSALWPFDPIDGPETLSWKSAEDLQKQGHVPVNKPKTMENSRRLRLQRAAGNVMRGGIEGDAEPALISEAAQVEANRQIEDWEQETQLLLGLLNEPVLGRSFELPSHVTASDMVALATNAEAVVENLRRPMPQRPGIAARVGNVFHSWVEEHFESAASFDFEDEAFADDEVDDALNVDELKENFLASEWAERTPWSIEYPIETPLELGTGEDTKRITVRGRVDAIFKTHDEDGEELWELVDWKTGRVPSAREMRHKSVQLALYRLAFAKLMDIPAESISGAFYYVASDKTVRLGTDELADETALLKLLKKAEKLGQKLV